MRVVVNKTSKPLKIHLPEGKTLHLGLRREGQVTPQALESPGVRTMIEAGELAIPDRGSQHTAHGGEGGGLAADTHGHHPNTTVRQHGDR
jgi:hypothetical protein